MKINILSLSLIILVSCKTNKEVKGVLVIKDAEQHTLLVDNDTTINDSNPSEIYINLSKDKAIELKTITNQRIGKDIVFILNGKVVNKLRVKSMIESGIVIIRPAKNSDEIFNSEAEAVKNLLPGEKAR